MYIIVVGGMFLSQIASIFASSDLTFDPEESSRNCCGKLRSIVYRLMMKLDAENIEYEEVFDLDEQENKKICSCESNHWSKQIEIKSDKISSLDQKRLVAEIEARKTADAKSAALQRYVNVLTDQLEKAHDTIAELEEKENLSPALTAHTNSINCTSTGGDSSDWSQDMCKLWEELQELTIKSMQAVEEVERLSSMDLVCDQSSTKMD